MFIKVFEDVEWRLQVFRGTFAKIVIVLPCFRVLHFGAGPRGRNHGDVTEGRVVGVRMRWRNFPFLFGGR